MSTDDTFVKQAKAKIHDWKHELIELQARVSQGVEDPAQSQIYTQRIIELQSQIDTTEKQIRDTSNV